MTGGTWRLTTALVLSANNLRSNAIADVPLSTNQSIAQSMTFGTNDNQFSVGCAIRRGLPPGDSVTYNLFDGSITDIYGDTQKFRILRSFACWISSGGDSSGLTIAGGDSNPTNLFWGGTNPTQTVYPSAPPASGGSQEGIAITSSAATIKITNNGLVDTEFVLLLAGSEAVGGVAMGPLGLTYP